MYPHYCYFQGFILIFLQDCNKFKKKFSFHDLLMDSAQI